MLEIYNEVVKDLLNPSSFTKNGLKVREDKKKGFYADGLTKVRKFVLQSYRMTSGDLETNFSVNLTARGSL